MVAFTRRHPWFVYVLETEDRYLYTGTAVDVGKRFARHAGGGGAKFFRMHPPREVVYVERCGSKGEALRREAEIKRLPVCDKRRLFR